MVWLILDATTCWPWWWWWWWSETLNATRRSRIGFLAKRSNFKLGLFPNSRFIFPIIFQLNDPIQCCFYYIVSRLIELEKYVAFGSLQNLENFCTYPTLQIKKLNCNGHFSAFCTRVVPFCSKFDVESFLIACRPIYLHTYVPSYLQTYYLPMYFLTYKPTTYLRTFLPINLLPTYLLIYKPTTYLPSYLPTYYLPTYLPTNLRTY